MRKTKSVIALGLALSLMLCSCGSDGSRARKSDSGQNTPGIASGSISDMGDNGSGSGDNGNGNGSSYDKPQIRIDIKDEKHADFILNTNSIIDTSFDDLTSFSFYMPDQYELEWESAGIGYADGDPTDRPELAILFHPEYAGLGECGTERSDSDLIVHMDMSEKEGFYFVEHFSFASLEGECVFFYNPPEDVPEDVRYSHEYTYNWADIAGMDNFSSEANKDMSSKLAGVWATEEFESTYTAPDGQLWGCMVRYFYVFYSDGTWSWAEIMDSRDDSGYHSVEDNFKKWYAGNKAASDHTYYFDGNEMKFKPDNDQDRNVTEASLEGKTLKLHVDYGRYLDQENTQSGSYNYYSGL